MQTSPSHAANGRDPLIGTTVAGRFRIIAGLGEGGMGVTYRAWDGETGRPVVLKQPKRDMLGNKGFLERFGREARMMAAFSHPHIVPVTMLGEHDGLPYLVMPFLPGGSLSNRRLRDESGKCRPMLPATIHLWLREVASALDHVHSRGVVHRDVKPANVFFNGFWHPYLGDFGIAKIVRDSSALEREQTLTATSMAIGTLEYMAPEMFAAKPVVDGRSDQYALAVMVYEMLVGERPFTGEPAQVIAGATMRPVPPLGGFRQDLPRSLEAAVLRGLAKDSQQRFTSCSEFAEAVLADVRPMTDEPGVARLLCPGCDNMLKLPISAAGKSGRCPRCKSQMMVAQDFSALWLASEETGGATAAPGFVSPARDDPSSWKVLPTGPVAKSAARHNAVLRAWGRMTPSTQLTAVATTMAALLFVEAIVVHEATSSGKTALRESYQRAVTKARDLEAETDKLTGHNATLLQQNTEVREEKQRLAAELKAVSTDRDRLTKELAAQRLASGTIVVDDPGIVPAPAATVPPPTAMLESPSGARTDVTSGDQPPGRGLDDLLQDPPTASRQPQQAVKPLQNGLKWIISHQLPDGGWSFDLANCPSCQGQCSQGVTTGFAADRCGATSMAILPFLRSGHTHKDGPYKKQVEAGLWFLSSMTLQGQGKAYGKGGNLYSQGFAGIVLAEAYGLTKDKKLKIAAQAALNYTMMSQDPNGGGWRYAPKQPGDTSATGWHVSALCIGREAGLAVAPDVLAKASAFLDRMQADGGQAYGYTDAGNKPGTSAVGLWCRVCLGWKNDNGVLRRGATRLAQQGPGTDLYFDYYATQVLQQVDGPERKTWNDRMRSIILESQADKGHEAGSWHTGVNGGHGADAGGRLYCTSLACTILAMASQ